MAGKPQSGGKNLRATVAVCVAFSVLVAFRTPDAGAQVPGVDCLQGVETSVSTITIASRDGALGATIAVPVTISTEGPPPTTILLIVEFDDSRLSYVRAELGSTVPSSYELGDNSEGDLISLVTINPQIDPEPIADGTLFNLFFDVADDAPLIATPLTAGVSGFTGPSGAVRVEDISGLIVCFVVDIVIVAGQVTPFVGPPPIGCGGVHSGRLRNGGTFALHWGDIAAILGSVVCLCATGRLRRSALR